jgi:hypothetical protein
LVPLAPSRVHQVVATDSDDESDVNVNVNHDIDISEKPASSLAPMETHAGIAGTIGPPPDPASAMSVDPSDEFWGLPHLEVPDPGEDDGDGDVNTDNVDFSFVHQDRALFNAFWETPPGFSDDEEPTDDEDDVVGLEDSDDKLDEFGSIDWRKFGVGEDGDLSTWDQLGVRYDQEFASICKSLWILAMDMYY